MQVQGSEITFIQLDQQDYISLTDIAKHKTNDSSAAIGNWMHNRNTIEFLGIWETLYNPDFNPFEFEGFKKQALYVNIDLNQSLDVVSKQVSNCCIVIINMQLMNGYCLIIQQNT
ncbi:MAG: KilA-N domain-containing protein [Alcaligenaceae bacterium]|nr:KilA-N domain-containing protein [Alcaligenaceae bacterium]